MKRVVIYSFLIVAVTCFLPIENAISQNLLVNGSFEESVGDVPLPTADITYIEGPNNSTIKGWTVSEIDWIFSLWNASDGDRSIDLNGNFAGYVEQTFSTTPGTSYIVTFDMAASSLFLLPDFKSVRATAAGASSDFGADPTGNTGTVRVYETKSFEFTANSNPTTLRLASLNFRQDWPVSATGPALDNVVVEEVPDNGPPDNGPPDNGPPDVSNATVSPSEIWPPNNKMVDITIGGVTDPDGDEVTITVTEITDNEGSNPKDVVTGTSPQVRAKRNGKGNGRTYTITYEASDGTNTVTGTLTVFVPHDKGKGKLKKGIASTSIPRDFTLNQNYPNPFNPTTSISYNIQEAVMVKLSVYDITGKLVKNLVSQQQASGRYLVKWDGTNESGRKVASGTYFYRLQAGSFNQTKKMILIK